MKFAFFDSIKSFPVFICIILATVILGYLFNRYAVRLIRKSSLYINNDPTNYKFLRHAITALIYIIGFGLAVNEFEPLRGIANSLLAGAGILAVAIGFASQAALSNIISGIMIIIFRPFRVNDRLKIRDNLSGTVEDITLRHTVIRDFENRRIIIPNDVISKEVIINSDFNDDKICKWIEVTIDYHSDIDQAKKILQEETMNHPFVRDGRNEEDKLNNVPIVVVRVIDLLDLGVRIRAWAWADDTSKASILRWDVLEKIKHRFDVEGIAIPVSNATINIKESNAKEN